MIKSLFISFQEKKEENRGSIEFQVFSFTNKIRRLTSHLELHRKDYLSQRGLRKILGKRQRLLTYLSKKNRVRYKVRFSDFFDTHQLKGDIFSIFVIAIAAAEAAIGSAIVSSIYRNRKSTRINQSTLLNK